ncbi:MAG: hypothetical protein WC819_05250 [Parcubacteria group bacterium]|jgi:hypothetical protein
MLLLFAIIYILFVLTIMLASFFIVTRLQEYSINPSFTKPLIIFFIVTTIALVIVNFSLFVSIPFDEIFSSSNLY